MQFPISRVTHILIPLFFLAAAGHAATLTVDTAADDPALTGCSAAVNDCSLRGAITVAVSGDSILFDPGVFMTPRLIRLTNGQLFINKDLTISGEGGVIIDAGRASRVIEVAAGVTVSLNDMTITGGMTPVEVLPSNGGGIFNRGTLTITGVRVVGNTVTDSSNQNNGGGISNWGTLTVVNSVISDNLAASNGGGIYHIGTSLTVAGSVISGNSATDSGHGGGVHLFQGVGPGTISNSAITDNFARTAGGILAETSLDISNSTVSDNHVTISGGGIVYASGSGGGTWTNITVTGNVVSTIVNPQFRPGGGILISSSGGSPVIRNSLVGGNLAGVDLDIAGTFISGGNNLVQKRGNSSGYIASDLPDGTDPLLNRMDNNGGTSPTFSLSAMSPAIDAGNSSLAVGTADQRGVPFARIAGSAIDIGAFETQSPTAAAVSVGGRVVQKGGSGVGNAQVILRDPIAGVCSANTNPFGYYRIDGIPAGHSYIFDVRHKEFLFSPQVVTVNGDVQDLDLVVSSPN